MAQTRGSVLSKQTIPDGDHMMRFVPYKQQQRDPDTDEFMGILGTAFSVRESDKGGLSLTWLEHYGPHERSTVEMAASAFRDTLREKKLGGKSYFAVGLAGLTRTTAAQYDKQIRIVHAPDGPNTGHVELHRFSDEDRRLLDALSLEVYVDHIPVAGMTLR